MLTGGHSKLTAALLATVTLLLCGGVHGDTCQWTSTSECDCSADPPPFVGEGYNAFVGFPVTFNYQCNDPGFTSTQVLNVASTGCVQQGINECSYEGQSQTFYSQSGFTSSAADTIGVEADSFGASVTWSTYAKSDSSDSNTFQSTYTSCLFSSAKVGLADVSQWEVSAGFERAINTLALGPTPPSPDDLSAFVNAFGLYYVREVTGYGGMTTYVSITSATNTYAQQSSGLDLSATAATSALQANSSADYNDSAYQQTAAGATFFQGCFTPATLNPLSNYSTSGLTTEAATAWQNALIHQANVANVVVPISYVLSPTIELLDCTNVNCTRMWPGISESSLSELATYILQFAASTDAYTGDGYCDQVGVNCIPASSQCAANTYNAAADGEPADCQSCAPAGCNWKGTASCTESSCECTGSYQGAQCENNWYGTCEGVHDGNECVVADNPACTNPDNPTPWAQWNSGSSVCVCQCQAGSGNNGAGGCCGTSCCGSGCTPHHSSSYCGSGSGNTNP